MLLCLLLLKNHRENVLCLCIFLYASAFCSNALCNLPSSYQQGIAAVKAENYLLAIDHFNQIVHHNTGSEKNLPLVYYNLGVCYYRIAHYNQAIESFKQSMSSDELLWRSVFNLALVAQKQQRLSYAEKLYQKIIDDADDPALIALAKSHQRQLQEKQLQQRQEKQRKELSSSTTVSPVATDSYEWMGIIYTGLGQESGVFDPRDLSGSDSRDNFNEIYAGLYRPLMVEDNSYWVFNTLIYTLRYESIEEYDVNLINAGFGRKWLADNRLMSAGIAVERTTVGQDDYLFEYDIHVSSRWTLPSSATLLLEYHVYDYDALDKRYDPLDGSRHKLQITFATPRTNRINWTARVFAMHDDKEDRQDAISFTSFSAFRQGVFAALSYHNTAWELAFDVDFRNSRYDDANWLQHEPAKTRQDERLKTSLNWQYTIASQWMLTMKYQYTDNKSTIKNYRYNGAIVTAGLNYRF